MAQGREDAARARMPPPGSDGAPRGQGPPRVVPSGAWPSLAAAVAEAPDGTFIQVLAGHAETLAAPLIIDHNICIEGPAEGSARLFGEESVIVAAGKELDAVFLRHLKLEVTRVPALVLAGACTVEQCTIEGAEVGVEVAAHAGSVVRIQHSIVRACRVGVSLAGGSEAVLEGTVIEGCRQGVAVTGLTVHEGWNPTLGSLAGATFLRNAEDLVLRAWGVQGRRGGAELRAAAESEVAVRGWPAEACSVVAPLESGGAVLHFSGASVNATLFEEEGEESESSCSTPGVRRPSGGPAVFRVAEPEAEEAAGEAATAPPPA
uniref:Right handed beta helix domain-containing protein n=1 Tax=Alexandrium catenella TaxID=2925 RepID=A0A7S1QGA3_ALECA